MSNHLSYLDVLVLGATVPSVFVAKREVATWPVLGWFARAAGTIFVDRERKTSAGSANGRIWGLLKQGMLVVLFPEGTSTDGRTILPFHSSLLQPAVDLQSPVTVACLGYRVADGLAEEEVCYWRDMTLLPHLTNLLGKRVVSASVHFQPALPRPERKVLARELHRQVIALRQRSEALS